MLIAQTTAPRNDSSHGIIHIHCVFWHPGDHYTLIGRCPNYIIAFILSNMLMCDQNNRYSLLGPTKVVHIFSTQLGPVLLHVAAIDCV